VALKAKILGTLVITLVLAGLGVILAYNWRVAAPPTIQTIAAGRSGTATISIRIPVNGCYLGASLEKMPPVDLEKVREFERVVGKGLAFLDLSYTDIGGKEGTIGFPEKDFMSLVRNGYLPAVRWFPLLSKSPEGKVTIPTLQVIDGKCDANIGIWATGSKNFRVCCI
jgi:hypothetical protein